MNVGDEAGFITKSNHPHRVIKINNKSYKAHRLAWLYMTGSFPKNVIDHKDGNPSNNVFSNIREATSSENKQNEKKRNDNTSGYVGVGKRGNKYVANIGVNKQKIFLGYFTTPELAYESYLKAKSKLHVFNPTPREN